MQSVDVYNKQNQKVGSVVANDAIFGIEPNDYAIQHSVRMHLSNQRQGSAFTKNRALVRGGGKKPFRQKGTGNARAGSTRSPIWVGGGTIFGPQPRSYAMKSNKKVSKLALCSALALKNKEGRVHVVDHLKLETFKTKQLVALLMAFGVGRALIVDQDNSNLFISARNLSHVKCVNIHGITPYDLLKYQDLIITKECFEKLNGMKV